MAGSTKAVQAAVNRQVAGSTPAPPAFSMLRWLRANGLPDDYFCKGGSGVDAGGWPLRPS